jgi:hypothetical protein
MNWDNSIVALFKRVEYAYNFEEFDKFMVKIENKSQDT